MGKKTIAIIPARGGSKAIPRKNLYKLGGIPLVGHVIKTALSVSKIGRVIVSTEDKEISEVAMEYGAEVPFMRPKELADDYTGSIPILQHAIKYLQRDESYKPDIIVLLFPTSPLLEPQFIEKGINKLIKGNFDSVISVCKARYTLLWKQNGEKFIPLFKKTVRRQDAETLYKENGAIYIMTYDTLINKNSIYGENTGVIIMDEMDSIDIDEPFDLIIAETLFKKREIERRV